MNIKLLIFVTLTSYIQVVKEKGISVRTEIPLLKITI